jgi:hypothetical protein
MYAYLPSSVPDAPHCNRDYGIILFSLIFITIVVNYDGTQGELADQKILAVMTWTALIAMLWGETKAVRMQVILTLIFATMAELFAASYMECYLYRFNNLPAYVPPGHGIVYLAIVALARSGFFLCYARKIAIFAVASGGVWSLWGAVLASREDVTGAVLFCIFLAYLIKGRAPMIYLGAFFISTWLEIVGNFSVTWAWAENDPIFGFTQANPPSGVAACYCFVDYLSIITTKFALKSWSSLLKSFSFKTGSS